MHPTLTSELESAVLELTCIAAAAVTAWLMASIIGWWLALRQGQPRPSRWQQLAVPGTRRLAEFLLGVSFLGLASCSTPATTPMLTLIESPATPSSTTTFSTTTLSSLAPPTTALPTTALATTAPTTTTQTTTAPQNTEPLPFEPPPAPAVATSATYVVQPGDSLWTIACTLLEQRNEAPPTSTETADYWRELLDANRSRITSGDVDLIFPGEELQLE